MLLLFAIWPLAEEFEEERGTVAPPPFLLCVLDGVPSREEEIAAAVGLRTLPWLLSPEEVAEIIGFAGMIIILPIFGSCIFVLLFGGGTTVERCRLDRSTSSSPLIISSSSQPVVGDGDMVGVDFWFLLFEERPLFSALSSSLSLPLSLLLPFPIIIFAAELRSSSTEFEAEFAQALRKEKAPLS